MGRITLPWVEKIRMLRAGGLLSDTAIVDFMLAYGLSEEERITNCFDKKNNKGDM
jgi:hypothetical protein